MNVFKVGQGIQVPAIKWSFSDAGFFQYKEHHQKVIQYHEDLVEDDMNLETPTFFPLKNNLFIDLLILDKDIVKLSDTCNLIFYKILVVDYAKVVWIESEILESEILKTPRDKNP